MKKLLSRLVDRRIAPPVRLTARFRPRLENLEGREVPAMVFWTGEVSTAFGNPDNWTTDEWNQPHRLPAAGDDVYFSAYGGSTEGRPSQGGPNGPEGGEGPLGPLPENHVDCVGFYGGQYKSVTLDVTYQATVYLAAAVGTGALNLNSGAISQPTSGTDITVSPFGSFPGSFIWQGGVLNSSENAATLFLIGNTVGLINPGGSNTLTTGDTLSFEGGATTAIKAGTLHFARGNGMVIGDGGTVEVQPGTEAVAMIKGIDTTMQMVTHILGGGYYKVVKDPDNPGQAPRFHTTQLPIWLDGGSFEIRDRTTVTVTGQVGGSGPSLYQTTGNCIIQADSKLIVPYGFTTSGGRLYYSIPANEGSKTVTIEGDLIVDGGRVENYERNNYGTLYVTGQITWYSGGYRPLVKSNDGLLCDNWWSGGTFTVGANAWIEPLFDNNPSTPGLTWQILTSDTSFAGSTPALTPINQLFEMVPNTVNNPWKWYLRRTP